jgi:hypothetical protein
MDNQKQIEASRKDYIFRRNDQDQIMDSQGRVKSTDTKEYEVYFVGLWEIERLLSKNGKPLSERERQREDEEVRKQEAKARKMIAREESGEDPDREAFTVAKFLAADRFYDLRRTAYEGREVYAMDFAPRPEFRAHSIVERVLKALGGTLWIDEQARQAARVEARFLESVKAGAGLAAVEKGGNVVLEQRYVNDEVWMPSYVEVHLNARVFFLHRSINFISAYSDYRKFRVNSQISGGATPVPAPKP